jgi:hypothetical protein
MKHLELSYKSGTLKVKTYGRDLRDSSERLEGVSGERHG